jgi:hypothetical protein
MTSYPKPKSPYTLVIYDLRVPGAAERLDRDYKAWGLRSELHTFGETHVILEIKAGVGSPR